MHAIGVLPPFLAFAAVRAMAPVAGIPPKRTDAMLPAPWATSSILELCLEFTILSATTQDKSDSMAAKIAIDGQKSLLDKYKNDAAYGKMGAFWKFFYRGKE